MRPQAQRLDSHMGKILRIAPDGSVPKDNPFVGKAGALPEIWSLGHRNVQAAAFDPQGRLWEVEHGTNGGDELNLVEKGKNYGWPLQAYGEEYSGEPISGAATVREGMEQPVYYWDPVIAPSGAQFYTGDAFPAWRNNLFIGSMKDQMLVRLTLENDRVTGEEHLLKDRGQRVRDVRQGPDGALVPRHRPAAGRALEDRAPPLSGAARLHERQLHRWRRIARRQTLEQRRRRPEAGVAMRVPRELPHPPQDPIQSHLVGIEHRSAARPRKAVTGEIHDVDVARPRGDPFLEDPRAFVHQGVDQAVHDLAVARSRRGETPISARCDAMSSLHRGRWGRATRALGIVVPAASGLLTQAPELAELVRQGGVEIPRTFRATALPYRQADIVTHQVADPKRTHREPERLHGPVDLLRASRPPRPGTRPAWCSLRASGCR